MAGKTKTKVILKEITTHSAEETIAFGRTLAELLTPPKLVLLRGDLGAGKTTLVKGIAAAFEAAAEEEFTIASQQGFALWRATGTFFKGAGMLLHDQWSAHRLAAAAPVTANG